MGSADSNLPQTGNMFTAEKVCFSRNKSQGNRDGEVTAQVFGPTNFRSLCETLTVCHSPKAFERCREYNQMGDDKLTRQFIEEHFGSIKISDVSNAGNYPLQDATVHKSMPLMTITGNIGHDVYNTLLDVYGFQQLHGGPGFYDALFLDVMWFKGKSSWDEVRSSPEKSWTWTVIEAIFKNNNITGTMPRYYVSNPGMVRSSGFHDNLGDRPICVDRLHIKAGGLFAENVGWDVLKYIPSFRNDVLTQYESRLFEFQRSSNTANRRIITLYTRGDANRRKFLTGDVDRVAEKIGANHLIVKMPISDPVHQIMTYATSDVFIAPFGSNTANGIFMKPGSIFIEVSTLCSDMCVEMCHPYSKVGANGTDSMASHMSGIERHAACSNLMADGPPLHQSSGVRYHIIGDCSKNIHCKDGKVYDGERELLQRKAWKKGFNDNISLDGIADKIIDIIQGKASAVKETLAAPFEFSCPLAPT